jgi:COP9 signalosome complex subunit 2
MSDEESYEYEYDSQASEDEAMNSGDEESFQYTDDEEEVDDVDVALENAYYNAKGLRDSDDVKEALEMFESVLTMENAELSKSKDEEGVRYGSWSYKALKQIVKLELDKTASSAEDQVYEGTKKSYQRLLECLSSPRLEGVSPNAIEKGINAMLERVALLLQDSNTSNARNIACQDLARYVYDSTLGLFNPDMGKCPNERLWFKTNLKYGQLLYEMNETSKLQSVIRDLLKATNPNQDSSTSATSSTNLMEIYALQIQLYSRQKVRFLVCMYLSIPIKTLHMI